LSNPPSGYGYVEPAAADATVAPAVTSLHQKKHHHHKRNKDIAEKQIDEQVYDFARDNVNPLAWTRS